MKGCDVTVGDALLLSGLRISAEALGRFVPVHFALISADICFIWGPVFLTGRSCGSVPEVSSEAAGEVGLSVVG